MAAPEAGPGVSPIKAGLRCKCPRCGRGALYAGFLEVAYKLLWALGCDAPHNVNIVGQANAVEGMLTILVPHFNSVHGLLSHFGVPAKLLGARRDVSVDLRRLRSQPGS